MEKELSNTVSVLGNYNEIPVTFSSEALVVTMLDGLTVTKTADKAVWADGHLTYTVTVDNQTTQNFTTPVITDILDITLVSFVPESVMIDDVKATSEQYTYAEDTGTLTVKLSDIAPTSSTKVTFQVTKKA